MSHLGAYVLSKYFAFIYVRVYRNQTDRRVRAYSAPKGN
jgi:hypothetical protein